MTIVYSARWVLPVSVPPIPYGAVAVHNGVITAVGPEEVVRESVAKDGPYQTVSLGETALTPGFVNVHSHLELTALRGLLDELPFYPWITKLVELKREKLRAADFQIAARWGVIEAIRSGITTLADTGDSGAPMDAMVTGGVRGIVYQEVFGLEMLKAKRSLGDLKRKIQTLRRHETSLVKVGVSPHAPYTVSKLLFQLTTEFAEQDKLPMCIHTAESRAEEDFMRQGLGPIGDSYRRRDIQWSPPGVSTIRYLADLNVLRVKPLLVHCVRATEEDIGLLALWDARVAHCPKSNAKFGHGIAPALRMRRRGIPVGLGTDSVASNNVCDLLDEARFTGLLHRASMGDDSVLPASDLLEWMTLGGATALGLENRIGTLDVGKDADITAISLSGAHTQPVHDPAVALLASASGRDVIMTMVRGKVLFDGQNVLTFDENRLRNQLQETAARLHS